MIYFAINEFMQYRVITTTKIKSEKEMILPGLTFCVEYHFNQTDMEPFIAKDMVLECKLPRNSTTSKSCNLTDLTLLNEFEFDNKCFQINVGKNRELLAKSVSEGPEFGIHIFLYFPNSDISYSVKLGISDNSASVVYHDVNKYLYPGYNTQVALSKTNQIALGTPYSDCNDSVDYRSLTCIDDCFNKKVSVACGCDWEEAKCRKSCKDSWRDTSKIEIIDEIFSNPITIKSQCRLKCPVECNQVTFSFNRIDIALSGENIGDNEDFLYYTDSKLNAEKKFNLTDLSQEDFDKRATVLLIYFERLETTEINERDAFSSIFSVGGSIRSLIPKEVNNLEAAINNVNEFTAETIHKLISNNKNEAK